MSTVAFRFDVDSVRCCRVGVPRLMGVADRLGVRFSFYLNMGYTFNWRHTLIRVMRNQLQRRCGLRGGVSSERVDALPAMARLGAAGVLETMVLNPMLGNRFRATFEKLLEAGHELGIHGGTDHLRWQDGLDRLSDDQLDGLFRPAYENFRREYGKPRGLASPGFRYDDRVLRLTDEYGFKYASDMSGEVPFRPVMARRKMAHWQIPVNVAGDGRVPLLEQMLARGLGDGQIVRLIADAIRRREFALMYGHPYVEGVRADLIERIVREVRKTHEVVTVWEYLTRYRRLA